jgi:hypothetical protein
MWKMVISCIIFLLYVPDYKLKKIVKMSLQGLVTSPYRESQSVSWYTKCICTIPWAIPLSNRAYLKCECCSVQCIVLDSINILKQNNLIIYS